MRGLYLFVAGILAGLSIQLAIAQNESRGTTGLNHVAISVANIEDAVTYYSATLGFAEAFRVVDDTGQPALVYMQISRNTFIELQPAHAQRPPGINHFGVQVEDMAAATATFKKRGADVSDTRVGSTKAILSNIHDPNGIRIELLELPPESLTGQAIENWQ
jgi:catechol 2,3-dioxygenase-like lactoylglutathione lyase family enzyme